MRPSYGIAIIGTGYIGQALGLAYGAVNQVFPDLPRVRKELVVDINYENAELFARRHGFNHAVSDWRSVLDNPNIDAVVVAAPNYLHKELSIAALEAGKHVHCEKPMAVTLDDAEQMAQAARDCSSETLSGYNYSLNPMIALAQQIIDDGVIGRPHFFRGVNDEHYLADPGIAWSWRCQKEVAGLGVIADLGSHLIDLAQRLMGPIQSVLGNTSISHKARPVRVGSDVPAQSEAYRSVENEDIASFFATFENGAQGELSCSRVAWGRTNKLAFEIQGEKGAILFDQERMNELKLFVADTKGVTTGFTTIQAGPDHPPYNAFIHSAGHQIGFNDLKTIEARNFMQVINGDVTNSWSFGEAIKTERVMHAIVKSSETRKIITLN